MSSVINGLGLPAKHATDSNKTFEIRHENFILKCRNKLSTLNLRQLDFFLKKLESAINNFNTKM